MKKILADREKFKQPTEKQKDNKSITKTADKVTATYKEQKGKEQWQRTLKRYHQYRRL